MSVSALTRALYVYFFQYTQLYKIRDLDFQKKTRRKLHSSSLMNFSCIHAVFVVS